MELESNASEGLLRGVEGVPDEGKFREMNRTWRETGQKNMKRFMKEPVHSPVRHQNEMCYGKCRSALSRAKPPIGYCACMYV